MSKDKRMKRMMDSMDEAPPMKKTKKSMDEFPPMEKNKKGKKMSKKKVALYRSINSQQLN